MQKYKVSFKGQNIFVGIDVHLKTWHVVAITESGYKVSFGQRSDARVLFDTLNRKFPDAHIKSAYEAGFCGFSVHYKLTEVGFENIVINPADVPTSNKENFELLTSVPGIGEITGMSLFTEIDNNPGRFSNERQFASFLGLIPTCHDSGEKKTKGAKTFRGNHQIGPLIVEASWIAIRNDRELSNWYINYCQRMKPQSAIIKIARKLACKIFAVLKTKKKYVHQ